LRQELPQGAIDQAAKGQELALGRWRGRKIKKQLTSSFLRPSVSIDAAAATVNAAEAAR